MKTPAELFENKLSLSVKNRRFLIKLSPLFTPYVYNWLIIKIKCDPDWIRTNGLLLSVPTTTFVAFASGEIWGLDYNFTISGVPRLVSTEPF